MDLIYLYRLPKWNLNYAYYRDSRNRINRRPYWIYCIYIDYQNEIRIMLIIEMAKIELIGGHIEFMLIIEMAKIEINRRLYWIYANCRDGQNRN